MVKRAAGARGRRRGESADADADADEKKKRRAVGVGSRFFFLAAPGCRATPATPRPLDAEAEGINHPSRAKGRATPSLSPFHFPPPLSP